MGVCCDMVSSLKREHLRGIAYIKQESTHQDIPKLDGFGFLDNIYGGFEEDCTCSGIPYNFDNGLLCHVLAAFLAFATRKIYISASLSIFCFRPLYYFVGFPTGEG